MIAYYFLGHPVYALGDIHIDVPQPNYWGCVPGIPGRVGASGKVLQNG